RSVERIRIAVVLPAPFGPRRPKTVPSRATMSMPSSARTFPNVLTRPSASIAEVVMASFLLSSGVSTERRASTHRLQAIIRVEVAILWPVSVRTSEGASRPSRRRPADPAGQGAGHGGRARRRARDLRAHGSPRPRGALDGRDPGLLPGRTGRWVVAARWFEN